jgi:hypothetical protein
MDGSIPRHIQLTPSTGGLKITVRQANFSYGLGLVTWFGFQVGVIFLVYPDLEDIFKNGNAGIYWLPIAVIVWINLSMLLRLANRTDITIDKSMLKVKSHPFKFLATPDVEIANKSIHQLYVKMRRGKKSPPIYRLCAITGYYKDFLLYKGDKNETQWLENTLREHLEIPYERVEVPLGKRESIVSSSPR